MPWKMYLIERTQYCRRSLRRFYNSNGRPPIDPTHYHDETVIIDAQFDSPGDDNGRSTDIRGYENDSRWPKTCRCGYTFAPEDHWQMIEERLWKGSPDGKLYCLREHPPGATWVSDWFPEEGPNGQWTGPDGKVWCVMLPTGMEWIIYSLASGTKSKWDVQGTPPDISVHPSVNQVGCWHGYIRNGIVSDDCEGRKFPNWPSTA